jgi:hypothetical protein
LSDLQNILACPRCGTSLDHYRCLACQLDFPVIADIPWLFADPGATRTEWRNRWHLALADMEQRQQRVQSAKQQTARASTRRRLQILEEGYQHQIAAIRELLGSLQLGPTADLTTYLALKTRPPPHSSLFSYDANVFRDWCWGAEENRLSCEAVAGSLASERPKRLLVLGAGAGRLAYDLHQTLTPDLTVALDMNPYLSTVTRRVVTGERLELVEFPRSPVNADAVALKRTLAAPEPARSGFEVVLADALRPPFQPGVFDAVVTPWLLDVVDTAPAEMIARLNPLLAQSGSWVLHGSLAFEQAAPADRPDLAELEEIAGDCGFADIVSSEQLSPYLDCPDSRHARRESVVTMRARKVAQAEGLPKYQALPDWLARGREPIPLLPAFATQAMTTRIHAFIMTLVDGKRSLKDIAQVLEDQQLLPKADAEVAIRGFLIKMFEEAVRRQD